MRTGYSVIKKNDIVNETKDEPRKNKRAKKHLFGE